MFRPIKLPNEQIILNALTRMCFSLTSPSSPSIKC